MVAVGSGADVAVAAICATSPPSPSSAPQLTNISPSTTTDCCGQQIENVGM